jgi:cation transport ATPase
MRCCIIPIAAHRPTRLRRTGTIPSTASIFLTQRDQLDRVLPAIEIARRSRFIALESVYAGIGLSVAGMVAAALGLMTPVQGAIFQEVIDVAVIVNALRALYD